MECKSKRPLTLGRSGWADLKSRSRCRTCIKTRLKTSVKRERIIRFNHYFSSLEEDRPTARRIGRWLNRYCQTRSRERERERQTDLDLEPNHRRRWFQVRCITNDHAADVRHHITNDHVTGVRRWCYDLPWSSLDRCRLEVFVADLESPSLQRPFQLFFWILFVQIFGC